MDKAQLLDAVNEKLKYYTIALTTKALAEDGKYLEGDEVVGYALVNKVTGITEHTSTMLPGVMWQAQHFEATIDSVLTPEPEAVPTGEDILPFDRQH